MPAVLSAAITPEAAGYLDVTVAPFHADPTGRLDATDALQQAFDEGVRQTRPVFLPAGVYKVSRQIRVDKAPHKSREENGLTVKGPSSGGGRAVLRLARGSLNDPARPEPVVGVYYDKVTPGDRLCVVIQSVDVQIEPENSGAVGLAWGGAEASAVWDVHIRGVDGYRGYKYGFWTAPASGGSLAHTSVDGGEYGYYLNGGIGGMAEGSRETVSLTNITSTGARVGAMYLKQQWACVVTGGRFVLDAGVAAVHRANTGVGHQWAMSGAPILVDTAVEWAGPDPKNVLFSFDGLPMPFYLENVYLLNCSAVLDQQDRINAKTEGWQHLAQLAYDSDNRGTVLGYPVKTGIYLNGTRQTGKVFRVDGEAGQAPPADLQSRHSWGTSFPDLLSDGAVLLTDYAQHKKGDDWQPVFDHVINTIRAPVIVVPKGDYPIRSTITMGRDTAIVGTIQWFTQLWGVDDAQRFGGSADAPNDARPMLTTPEGGRPLLADLRIMYRADKSSGRALAVYPVLWRGGADSILRNVYAQAETDGAYWIHQTADILAKDEPQGTRLRVMPSPADIGGLRFSTQSRTRYHDGIDIPDQIIFETVGGNRRLVVPSVWPFPDDAATPPAFRESNLTIEHAGQPFTLRRLNLANPSPLNGRGSTVLITRYDAAGKAAGTRSVSLRDIPRTRYVEVELGWSNCAKVVLTSPTQFAVDDIVVEGRPTITFEDIEGTVPVVDKHYDSWNPAGIWRDLGLSPQYYPNITIAGGAKLYNHAVHGGQAELNCRTPHTLVSGNSAPVRIYHFHAQHGDNDGYLHLRNARDVRLFGMKTESSTSFIRCYDSENIRLYGMGGATNPVTGHSYFHFDTCRDYRVACAFDVVYNKKAMIWGGEVRPWGNAHQNASNRFDAYNAVEEYRNGELVSPAKGERPTLWQMP